MMATGWRAYANARVRGRRSSLLGPEDAAVLRAAATRTDAVRRLVEARVVDAADPDSDGALFRRVLSTYHLVLRSCPEAGPPVRALLALHELENLKLAWRARVNGARPEAWVPQWRDLGPLGTLRLDAWRDATSLRQGVTSTAATMFGPLADRVLRAHASDLRAAEAAFDRWGSDGLVAAMRGLPRREARAAGLLKRLLVERDCDLLARAAAYERPADVAMAATAWIGQELSRDRLQRLVTWKPGPLPLGALVPRAWIGQSDAASDWDALVDALRRERRRACLRAFAGPPFELAAPVALVMLADEERRALTSLIDAAGAPDVEIALDRAASASALGA